jgi:hypothetical protein
MGLLQALFVYTIACIVGFYISVRLAIRYFCNPSAFPVKKRDRPPACLIDPALGTHGYLSLKVSIQNMICNVFFYSRLWSIFRHSLMSHTHSRKLAYTRVIIYLAYETERRGRLVSTPLSFRRGPKPQPEDRLS